ECDEKARGTRCSSSARPRERALAQLRELDEQRIKRALFEAARFARLVAWERRSQTRHTIGDAPWQCDAFDDRLHELEGSAHAIGLVSAGLEQGLKEERGPEQHVIEGSACLLRAL